MKEPSLVNENLLRQRLTELGSISSWAPHAFSGLERFIRTAGDYDLFRVNPIQYATANGLSEAEGIELFVHAAKVGLFEMQWLLICAYCPQVAGSFRELDQVHPRFQCASATRSTMWRWTTTFRSPLRSRAACATSYSAIPKCCLSRIFTYATTFPRVSSRRTG